MATSFPTRNLRPVTGIRDRALYTNVVELQDHAKGAVARKAAAVAEAQTEARLKRKVDQANRVLDALEAREQAIANAIKELNEQRKETSARIARIEDGVIALMDEARVQNVSGNRRSFRLQQSPEALEVVDESMIPREYMRTPKTPPATPDKVAIKKALAADETIAPSMWGCKLTSKTSLVRS